MRTSTSVLALCAMVGTASADVPISWQEPDEEFAKTILGEWLTAVRTSNQDALVALGGFDAGAAAYVQATVPVNPTLAKRCRVPSASKTPKAMRSALRCLFTKDISTALGDFRADDPASGSVSFYEKLSDVSVDSREWTAARKLLTKLDATHVFVTVTGLKGDGVYHQVVLAISVETATGQNRVGSVVHWTTKP